ncbi:metallophosphoesterase family protein [Aequorivita antarctica]|uniref:Metallophosphoesterase n=1 Tax=Aequorivita antarctica TaxID=153266 RepID=A0A5C6Z020_9FLAO|nr:metallophosphoesterase [Aequorivita antarctica]TXD73334.1 metallophosphoesterase [Aequorivita antarctica]SRX76447.1 3',5'-cyclic adenosine monophosphate phosphodiesterase CpdA [Aequorivita antarctica]
MENDNNTTIIFSVNKKIAYITDIYLDEQFPIDKGVDARKNWEIILNDISKRGIGEIIFGGDIGKKTVNKWFFESLHNYNVAITLGNHDYFDEVINHYSFGVIENRTELHYTQEHNYYKFLFLDSSSGSISQEQFDWFKKELLTEKNIILFIHHPILAVDTEVDRQFALKNRNLLKTELQSLENDVVIFCGHYHFEDERSNSNIRQYITPASSYQVEKIPDEIKVNSETFGYRIIELNKSEINTEVITFTAG